MINEKLDQHVASMMEGYQLEKELFTGFKKFFPSRKAVIDITEEIEHLLFPGYFDNECHAGCCSDQLVAERLIRINRVLETQIANALLFQEGESLDCEEANRRAALISEQFMDQLPKVQKMLLKDIQALFDGDPAADSKEEILLCYPGFYAIFAHRIAHELVLLGVPLIPRLMSEYVHGKTGIDIGPGATIGEYFFIDHGTGVVIGETTIIGNNVKIYQGVTLGATSTRHGQALASVKRHPTIEDNVTIYSNASVLGGDTVIGHDTVIGGSAFVCESVPPHSRVSVKNQEVNVRQAGTKHPSWDDCNQ